MKYEVGDSVKLNADRSFADGVTIKKGTRGVIRAVTILFYRVKYQGHAKERLTMEKFLDPA